MPANPGNLLELNDFRKLFPDCKPDDAQTFVAAINEFCPKFGINTPLRLAHFLAQAAHESMGWTAMHERLNYSAARLFQVFKRNDPPPFPTMKIAMQYAHRPEAIANRAYAGKNGNGPESTGDGFLFRGRGIVHLTGRANYRKTGKLIALPLEENPELAADPRNAVLIFCSYWDQTNLNPLADLNKIEAITHLINRAGEGMNFRKQWFAKIRKVLNA